MRLVNLRLQNFRGFTSLDLELHPELTVLVGVNGSGKTSVLDAIAVMLSWLTPKVGGFGTKDVQNGKESTEVELVFEHEGALGKNVYSPASRPPDDPFNQDRGWRKLVERREHRLAPLPLIGYYRVGRNAVDATPGSTEPGKWELDQAWDRALLPTGTSFEAFFQWFREREDIENEERRDAPEYRDRQLESVRQAIESLVPGASNPRVRRPRFQKSSPGPRLDHPVIVVTMAGQELAFEQLSEGERVTIAMAGDIARRLAIANPEGDPLQGDGVVLVDEIDLHLHPEWQAKVIPTLRRTFPNLQLVVTTHSPIVLANVGTDCVRLLKDFRLYVAPTPTEGRDANSLLAEIFEVPIRPERTQEKLRIIAELIDQERLTDASVALEELSRSLGESDAEVTRLRSFISLLES